MLHSINEAQIAHALRKRFEYAEFPTPVDPMAPTHPAPPSPPRASAPWCRQGRIYTWVGASATVLISINPYRMLPLYSLDTMEEHRLGARSF